MTNNQGFDQEEIKKLKEEIVASGRNYVVIESEDNNDEFINFYFIGMFEGKEVIYDAALYTLKMQHNSEIFELAQHKVAQKFPQYKAIDGFLGDLVFINKTNYPYDVKPPSKETKLSNSYISVMKIAYGLSQGKDKKYKSAYQEAIKDN